MNRAVFEKHVFENTHNNLGRAIWVSCRWCRAVSGRRPPRLASRWLSPNCPNFRAQIFLNFRHFFGVNRILLRVRISSPVDRCDLRGQGGSPPAGARRRGARRGGRGGGGLEWGVGRGPRGRWPIGSQFERVVFSSDQSKSPRAGCDLSV